MREYLIHKTYKQIVLLLLLFSIVFFIAQAKADESGYTDEFADYLDESGTNLKQQNSDKYSSYNRKVFFVNERIDYYFLEPIARTYRKVAGEYIIQRVRDFGSNLSQPSSFLNSIFQGNFTHAVQTFWRFAINTTYGIGGLFDVASQFGIPNFKNDFGLTLAFYGYSESNYFVIPLYSPSTVRDAYGFVVDAVLDPVNFILPGSSKSLFPLYTRPIIVISEREAVLDQTDRIYEVSLDKYSAIKSAYLQYRGNVVNQFLKTEKE